MTPSSWRRWRWVVPGIAAFVALIGGAGALALMLARLPLPFTWLAAPAALAAALLALVPFWFLCGDIEIVARGHGIRQACRRLHFWKRWPAGPHRYLYEEITPRGERRRLPFVLQVREDPLDAEVLLPGEARWDIAVPDWARGRRDEIASRIVEGFRSHAVVRDLD